LFGKHSPNFPTLPSQLASPVLLIVGCSDWSEHGLCTTILPERQGFPTTSDCEPPTSSLLKDGVLVSTATPAFRLRCLLRPTLAPPRCPSTSISVSVATAWRLRRPLSALRARLQARGPEAGWVGGRSKVKDPASAVGVSLLGTRCRPPTRQSLSWLCRRSLPRSSTNVTCGNGSERDQDLYCRNAHIYIALHYSLPHEAIAGKIAGRIHDFQPSPQGVPRISTPALLCYWQAPSLIAGISGALRPGLETSSALLTTILADTPRVLTVKACIALVRSP
jgi:hypothetical protein